MKKVFQTKNNDNFYYLKELQWSNKAMKLNPLNPQIRSKNNIQNVNQSNFLKEKSWNKRFIYNKIQNYDSAKDKNVVASFSKNDEMNCYHNALKKNDFIIKNFYSNNKVKKKGPVEYNKTNIRVNLNPMGKNIKRAKITNNSFSCNNINFKNKRMFSTDIIQAKKEFNDISKYLSNNSHNSPDKLTRIWNDLCILEPYRELFSIITTQLSDKNKGDFCEREFNELYELRTNLQLLSTSIYYRQKILENINFLNDKLGIILRSKQNNSNEVLLKKISKKIENLREHTVNICFLMQKIKSKINQAHPWGKFNLDSISEKYKFDKNYLIKMKEEMVVLKEGYTKYFFDIADDNNPFLLNASEPLDKKNKTSDPFFHYVPITNEMRENINQCTYIIFQELIGYQNNNVSENNFRNISPLKKYKYTELDIKLYKKHNESFNNSNNNSLFSLTNNNVWVRKSGVISPTRTNYSGMPKSSNFGGDKISTSKNNKRILSGNENENKNFNKIFSKMDKLSNDIEDKTTNYNNNMDIKDLINDKNTMNIEIDINNRKNEINSKENSKEEEKENEKFDDMNINNISNIKKEEQNHSKSEKEEFDLNNEEINNKDKIENNNIMNININKEKENGKNFLDNNIINNKLEEIIEEEKVKSDSNRNERNNKKEEIKENSKNEDIIDNNNGNNYTNKVDSKNEDNLKLNNEKMNENEEGNIEDNENTEDLEKQLKGDSKESNAENNKSNKSNSVLKQKKLKISIFKGDISLFSKDFYTYYFSSIPEIIKDMFKLEESVIKNILTGISPYLLLVQEKSLNPEEEINWINLKSSILGVCIFSFEYKNGVIKLIITHISTSNIIKEEEKSKTNIEPNTLEQFKNIFNTMIEYIKKNFYFDEIIIGYNSDKANDNILNIFLSDLNFVAINENDNEEIDDELTGKTNKFKAKNNEQHNKMVYTNDSTKNRVNDLIRKSIQKYLGKNIIDIFDALLITNNAELINLDKNKKNEGNFINNVLTKYLIDKKDKSNVNILYNKIQNLDQVIKLFQNNNINNKELPLSLAENRFDILCTAINKILFTSYFSNTTFFNNYNNNDSNSYLDKNSNIFYNYIKAEKVLILENDKYNIKFCHILTNNLSIFFCKMNEDFSKYIIKNNIYTQINNVYKDTLSMNKKKVFDDIIIWIPCFELYKHIKTLSNNSTGTIHEYIKISNKKINQANKELLRINANNNENCVFRIEPNLSRDFILDDDFIFGIINNAEILNEKILEKDKKDENRDDEDNIDEEIEGEEDYKDKPYVLFLVNVKKSDFILNNV